MIELADVGHVHDAETPWAARALEGVTLRVDAGERVLITGPNGSGKSTLAWIIAGHVSPTEGRATVAGRPAPESIAKTGFLLQHTRLQILAPTVAADGARFRIDPFLHRRSLHRLGFDDSVLNRKIDELSLGQVRRVALAALLARGCPLLVLDEPFAGLDRQSVERLVDAIEGLASDTTVVTITHDIEVSQPLGNRSIQLDRGRVVAS